MLALKEDCQRKVHCNLKVINIFSWCRCVYGKVEELTIQIPWTNPYSKPTHIEIQGLYMLMVPTSR